MNNLDIYHYNDMGMDKNIPYILRKKYTNRPYHIIEIEGRFGYDKQHDLLFSTVVEKDNLSNSLPCIYTDKRFDFLIDDYTNLKEIFFTLDKPISLKACIRRVNKIKNVSPNTVFNFSRLRYFDEKQGYRRYNKFYKGVYHHLDYLYKHKGSDSFKFNIDSTRFNVTGKAGFFSKLTEKLRINGFLVDVYNTYSDESVATAYGFGKIITYSTFINESYGSMASQDCVLWDFRSSFCKWSKAYGISKSTDVDEIITKLTTFNKS